MSEDTDLSFQNLEKGLSFCTKEDAEKYMKLWCDKHLFPLVVRGSFKGTETINGRIQYTCPHGVQRKTISTGERPLQHVLYTGCLAMVTITQNRQGNVWWVSKVHKEHSGHMCGAEVYGSYQTNKKMSDKDYQMITELESVGASRRRVASALSDKTGKQDLKEHAFN